MKPRNELPDHSGHRQRLKQKFLKGSPHALTDAQILELALNYCVPRRDTSGTAQRLLNEFTSLQGVISASFSDLANVHGVGENTAAFIKLINEINLRADVTPTDNPKVRINTVKSAVELLSPLLIQESNERLYAVLLDGDCYAQSIKLISGGTVLTTLFDIRAILKNALESNAEKIILAHNHPKGSAKPSNEDITATKELYKYLSPLDIVLTDHIIISEKDYFSFSANRLIRINDGEYIAKTAYI